MSSGGNLDDDDGIPDNFFDELEDNNFLDALVGSVVGGGDEENQEKKLKNRRNSDTEHKHQRSTSPLVQRCLKEIDKLTKDIQRRKRKLEKEISEKNSNINIRNKEINSLVSIVAGSSGGGGGGGGGSGSAIDGSVDAKRRRNRSRSRTRSRSRSKNSPPSNRSKSPMLQRRGDYDRHRKDRGRHAVPPSRRSRSISPRRFNRGDRNHRRSRSPELRKRRRSRSRSPAAPGSTKVGMTFLEELEKKFAAEGKAFPEKELLLQNNNKSRSTNSIPTTTTTTNSGGLLLNSMYPPQSTGIISCVPTHQMYEQPQHHQQQPHHQPTHQQPIHQPQQHHHHIQQNPYSIHRPYNNFGGLSGMPPGQQYSNYPTENSNLRPIDPALIQVSIRNVQDMAPKPVPAPVLSTPLYRQDAIISVKNNLMDNRLNNQTLGRINVNKSDVLTRCMAAITILRAEENNVPKTTFSFTRTSQISTSSAINTNNNSSGSSSSIQQQQQSQMTPLNSEKNVQFALTSLDGKSVSTLKNLPDSSKRITQILGINSNEILTKIRMKNLVDKITLDIEKDCSHQAEQSKQQQQQQQQQPQKQSNRAEKTVSIEIDSDYDEQSHLQQQQQQHEQNSSLGLAKIALTKSVQQSPMAIPAAILSPRKPKNVTVAVQTNIPLPSCKLCTERNEREFSTQSVQCEPMVKSQRTQTNNDNNFHDPLVKTLKLMNAAQLVAMRDYARILTDPRPANSADIYKLREELMDVYNLSNRDDDTVNVAERDRLNSVRNRKVDEDLRVLPRFRKSSSPSSSIISDQLSNSRFNMNNQMQNSNFNRNNNNNMGGGDNNMFNNRRGGGGDGGGCGGGGSGDGRYNDDGLEDEIMREREHRSQQIQYENDLRAFQLEEERRLQSMDCNNFNNNMNNGMDFNNQFMMGGGNGGNCGNGGNGGGGNGGAGFGDGDFNTGNNYGNFGNDNNNFNNNNNNNNNQSFRGKPRGKGGFRGGKHGKRA